MFGLTTDSTMKRYADLVMADPSLTSTPHEDLLALDDAILAKMPHLQHDAKTRAGIIRDLKMGSDPTRHYLSQASGAKIASAPPEGLLALSALKLAEGGPGMLRSVQLRARNAPMQTAAIASGLGALAGGVGGYMAADDKDKGMGALGGAAAGAIGGAVGGHFLGRRPQVGALPGLKAPEGGVAPKSHFDVLHAQHQGAQSSDLVNHLQGAYHQGDAALQQALDNHAMHIKTTLPAGQHEAALAHMMLAKNVAVERAHGGQGLLKGDEFGPVAPAPYPVDHAVEDPERGQDDSFSKGASALDALKLSGARNGY